MPVYPAICHAAVLPYESKRLNIILILSSANGSLIILVFQVLNKYICEISTGPLPMLGVEYRWDIQNFRLCVGNRIRYSHSCYGTLIGNHMRSIEPWHFRWPWDTFEGHFGDQLTAVAWWVHLACDLVTRCTSYRTALHLRSIRLRRQFHHCAKADRNQRIAPPRTYSEYSPRGRLSWLSVSFSLHVKYTLSYRIV